jgi:hypothetical protein
MAMTCPKCEHRTVDWDSRCQMYLCRTSDCQWRWHPPKKKTKPWEYWGDGATEMDQFLLWIAQQLSPETLQKLERIDLIQLHHVMGNLTES